MTEDKNIFGELTSLRDAVDRVAKGLGLKRSEQGSFGVAPAEGVDPNLVFVTFDIEEEALLSQVERDQRKVDASFLEIMTQNMEPEDEEAESPLGKAIKSSEQILSELWDDEEWE